MGRLVLRSVEDVSVMRKFSIFFLLLSVLPFILLTILFYILYLAGDIQLESRTLIIGSFFVVGFFLIVSFFAIRNSFFKVNKIASGVEGVLKGDTPKPIDLEENGNNEIAKIARSFNEVVLKLESSITDLEKSKSMLQEVLKLVASGVSSTENLDTFIDLILKTTVGALNAESGVLLLLSEDSSQLIIQSTYGLDENACRRNTRFPLDNETAIWVIKQKKPLVVPRLGPVSDQKAEGLNAAFQPPFICVPLVFKNNVLGLISVSASQKADSFKEDELLILSNITSQVALAIENSKLHSDAQKTYLETINALAMAVEARDQCSRGHSDRVGELAVKVAQKLGLEEQQIKTIKEASVLHDVGKIGINDSILLKPGKLTEIERSIMQQHPLIGEGIIVPLHNFANLRDPIRHHHEWIDGTGYPDRLKGDQISIEARILAVVDSFDAMTSQRPYRNAMSLAVAFEELNKYKGTRYDPKVVDALISCVSK